MIRLVIVARANGGDGVVLPPNRADQGRRVRVTVVYEHALLRDIAVRILNTAGADVAGVMRADEFCVRVLLALQPDVLVVDRAAADGLGWLSQAMVFGPNPSCATRVVTIGLSDNTVVTCQKKVVTKATANSFVEAVCEPLPLSA